MSQVDASAEKAFRQIWEAAYQTKMWHTLAGSMLDAIVAVALHPEFEEASAIAQSLKELLGDQQGTFLESWTSHFREDPAQAAADWQTEVAPDLIRAWIAQTEKTEGSTNGR